MAKYYKINNFFTVYKDKEDGVFAGLRDTGVLINLEPLIISKLVYLLSMAKFSNKYFIDLFTESNTLTIELTQDLLSALKESNVVVDYQESAISEDKHHSEFSWQENGWLSAKLFHDSVLNTTFIKGNSLGWETQLNGMAEINDSGAPPDVVKKYSLPGKKLSTAHQKREINFFDVIRNRKTIRSFNRQKPVTLDLVSEILHYSAQANSIVQSKYFGPLIKRNVPSGGSMHPIEIYPQLIGVDQINDGNYYYNHIEHSLFKLGEVEKSFIYELSQDQVSLNGHFIAFIITARFLRNFWKYRYSKSYIFTHLDAGHFAHNLILSCEALGLKCFLTPAIDVAMAQNHLGLSGNFDECAVYLIVAG